MTTQKMKRILSVALVLAMLLCASPLAYASETAEASEEMPAPETLSAEEADATVSDAAGALDDAPEAEQETPEEAPQPEETVQPEETATETPAQPSFSVILPGAEENVQTEEESVGTGADEIEHDPDDPLYDRYMNSISTMALAKDAFSRYTTRALNNETLHYGIDISEWQGTIDWKSVAASGIEFVFIRVAYRGSSTGALKPDAYYAKNLAGAKAAGLKVGAYIFSQALNAKEGKEEAQYLANLVSKYDIDLPLVIDYEYVGNYGRLYNAKLSRQTATNACIAFCDEVERLGYESMVYANPSMFSTQLYREQLGRVWLANYTTKTSYSGAYEYWQCSSTGSINGISGNVDLDFWFQPISNSTTVSPGDGDTSETENPFQDVIEGSWYYESVLRAYNEGIVKGMPDGFYPSNPATRGQVITMLYRMVGEPDVTGTTSFTDLTADYYVDAVTWASSTGVANGTSEKDATFSPDLDITREDLVTMLYRMTDGAKSDSDEALSAFSDASSIHSYAKDAMLWAVENGIITGYSDGTLLPRGSATRAEVCTILMRFDSLSC